MKKLLIIAPYSYPSACGIWKRAFDDAKILKNEFESITFFTSNILKGTKEKLEFRDKLENFEIFRFKSWFSFGANSLFFFHFFKLIKLNPDVIHVHGYRHPHSIQGLIFGKLMRKKVLITPHAPFEKDPRRSIVIKVFDNLYDLLIGWWELRLYDKIILTTHWEKKYLKRLGVNESKMAHIPNGIGEEFLKESDLKLKRDKNKFRAIFIGRLDPVKRLEWIIDASKEILDVDFKIYGPLSGYEDTEVVAESSNLEIIKERFNSSDFIREALNSHIFLSTSIRESFGITSLEAMSQGCIIISSNTRGAEEFIIHSQNGFIVKNPEELVSCINYVKENWDKLEDIRKNAIETAKKFNYGEIGKKLIEEYAELPA